LQSKIQIQQSIGQSATGSIRGETTKDQESVVVVVQYVCNMVPVPVVLGHLLPTNLGLLSLALPIVFRDNYLSGPIPSELGLLTNPAITMNFRNNQFSSAIPTQLGLLSNIQELDLLNNQLTGRLPTEFGKSIGHLSVASNSFSGSVPQEMEKLQHTLHILNLQGNSLMPWHYP
jgi:hypothetical protein